MLINLVFSQNTYAQVNGNKKYETKTYDIQDIETFNLHITGNVTVDANSDAALTITTDENIFEHLTVKKTGGKLYINQAVWIEATKMNITFGGKALKKIKTSGYSDVKLSNLNSDKFTLDIEVGNATLTGKSKSLVIKTETGEINAENVTADKAKVSIASHGTVKVNASEAVTGNIAGSGRLLYKGTPKNIQKNLKDRGEMQSMDEQKNEPKVEVKYIKLKLYNNKGKRIHTYVQGPRHRRFSYGMPFNPLQKRAENYPVGTEIWQVNKLGTKTKLLYTVKSTDEGKTVKLFKK